MAPIKPLFWTFQQHLLWQQRLATEESAFEHDLPIRWETIVARPYHPHHVLHSTIYIMYHFMADIQNVDSLSVLNIETTNQKYFFFYRSMNNGR
jgi:hypothetical protein